MVRATISLPVPLAPVINTDAVLGATISTRRKISCIFLEEPTSEPSDPLSRSLRRVTSSSILVPSRVVAFCRMVRKRLVSMGLVM